MKATELIVKLQALVEEHGDLQIVAMVGEGYDTEYGQNVYAKYHRLEGYEITFHPTMANPHILIAAEENE